MYPLFYLICRLTTTQNPIALKILFGLQNGLIGMFLAQWSDPVRITVYVLSVAIIILSSYILGSLNFAIIISKKQYNQDIRNYGSNNAGMTNMMRTYGRKAAALTLLGDIMKAVVACWIGYLLIGQIGSYIAGLFCILGHIFPVFYKFKGGKGVVTAGVTIFMCNIPVFLITVSIFLIIVAFTRYISLGSVMSMLFFPLILDRIDRLIFIEQEGSYGTIFAILITFLIVFKHWSNIKRLLAGKESKFTFKKSVSASEVKEKSEADNNN